MKFNDEKKQKEMPLWRKKTRYWMDEHISKGLRGQVILLVSFITAVVLIFGLISAVSNHAISTGEGIWSSLMHLMDPGTLAGDGTSNRTFIVLMLIVTLVGITLSSTLTSIIDNALSHKMHELRKGKSKIIEDGHTVIIGFNAGIFSILNELTEAAENNTRKTAIVIADDQDKEEMDQALLNHEIFDTEKIRFICRSGDLIQNSIYDQISLENSRSIIINYEDDYETMRILLAVTEYLKAKGKTDQCLVTLVHEKPTEIAVRGILKEFPNARVLFLEGMLSKILAQVCRQPGLSYVLAELFDYANSEIYIENRGKNGKLFPVEGKTFASVLNSFSNSVAIGYCHEENGKLVSRLAPDQQEIIGKDCRMILIARDDRISVFTEKSSTNEDNETAALSRHRELKPTEIHLLVLNWNESLTYTLKYLAPFIDCSCGRSRIIIAADTDYPEIEQTRALLNTGTGNSGSQGIPVEFKLFGKEFYRQETIQELLVRNDITNVLLVCPDGDNAKTSDAATMKLLLLLRDCVTTAERKLGRELIITSELNLADDQKLMQITDINDFVVGNEIANKILAQVSNEPNLDEIFKELLTEKGAEIYLRPVSDYIGIESCKKVSFGTMTSVVMHNNDVLIGWTRLQNGKKTYELNPLKSSTNIFDPEREKDIRTRDELIVISQGI
ncbi:MAG: hypothetical protein LKJ76_01295 [Lachnospiraceae bacterium]|jgi:hypothetical protein|nr:hypothetical protein [Lachnospiraceae bacterium]